MNPIAARELLQHTEFVRRVALALCADESGADDLVQETWLTALTRERPEGSRLRGWLGGVTRNLARQGRRGASRRDVRERSVALAEAQPSTSSAVERMETHKQVVSAILGLPAAAREVIVLSYFDGLPPREIASRLGVPVETVRSRVKRARARLREQLADEYESQPALVCALTELARQGVSEVALATSAATLVPAGGMIALAAVMTAVTGVGAWLLLVAPTNDVATPVSQETAGLTLVRPEPDRVSTPAGTRRALEAQPEVSAIQPGGTLGASRDEVARAPLLGTLIVRDVDGHELASENGEFTILPIGPTPHPARLVPFQAGRFRLEDVPAGRIRIQRASTALEDGPRPVVFESAQFEHRPGEALLLVGHYVPDSTLRVVDASTGAELDSVSVLPREGHVEQLHPGPFNSAALCVRNRPSPVRLPRTRSIRSYWVTAPGHTWCHLKVDHDRGGERTVRLQPAGHLAIEASGHDETFAIFLRVYDRVTNRVAASCSLDFNDAGPTFQGFGGIAVGDYSVRAEIGELDDPPTVLDEQVVSVLAGMTTDVFLEPISRGIPEAVAVSGTIVLPSGHEGLPVSLKILPANGARLRRWDTGAIDYAAMKWIDGADGVLTWYAERLTPGRYLFLVRPIQYGVLVDVPLTPIEDVRIELPRLQEVLVRVSEATSAVPVPDARLRWKRDLPVEAGPEGWVTLAMDPRSDHATLLVPPGPILVSADAPLHGQSFRSATIGNQPMELTLELPRSLLLEIVLRDGKANVPWVDGTTCTIQPVGGGGPRTCTANGDGRMRATVKQPGLYEVTVLAPEGYLPPAPALTRVAEGEAARLVIELSRSVP